MPDVPDAMIEAEQDIDYTYSYTYNYGLLDSTLRAIADAVSTTASNTLAVLEAQATTTAAQQTTAIANVTGAGTVSTTNTTTTADTVALLGTSTTATAISQTTVTTTTTTGGQSPTTAAATTRAATVITNATLEQSAVEWRVTRDGTEIEDAVYDVDPVVDTANPFGDYAVIKMDDRGGEKFAEYGRGTRVDIAVSENFGISFENRFTGYVVERRETEQQGADALEVEAYSFDQFLRRNTVSNDQTGNTISEAFQDIIETDTPVNYNAAKVEVGDNQTVTRSYQGEAVESVLRDFAFKSNNEEFGVDDDLDAFFRPRETEHIDRGIDNTQWFSYDIPELGKEAINEVEVWFDDGNESVIVDDGTDKLDLQDNLGLPSPGTQRAELNRPLITDIADAEDEGRKYLAFRNATLSGTVTTYGLFDAEPGDTIDITITPRGIDEEFVIAATEYRWGVDETILTIVEKRGDVDDILSELNDSVKRQEMETANREAPKNRITTTNAAAIITPTWDIDGTNPDGDRLVNSGRESIRDGWIGDGNPDVAEIRVGDSNAGLSRSNTALTNQTATASVTESLPDSTSVSYTATLTQTGVSEVGLFETDGTLITRATLDTPVDVNGDVSVTLDVSNDASVSRGVLTEGGQTVVRDVIADNTPDIPDEYGYGSDGTPVAESDTALANEVIRVSLDEIPIQSANATSEWESLVPPDATTPLKAQNDRLELLQTSFTTEGEDYDRQNGTNLFALADFSDGSSVELEGSGEWVEWDFTTEYDIPDGDLEIWVRWTAGDSDPPNIEWSLDGTTLGTYSPATNQILWRDIIEQAGPFGSSLSAGSHTLRAEVVTGGTQGWQIDIVDPRDGRFSYTNDNSNDGSGGYLDGPELFPSQYVQAFATAETRRLIDEARFTSTWNDISNNQYIELANDGTNFTRFDNTDSGTVNFASSESGVDTNIALGRYGTRTTATPQTGFNGQYIDSWQLFASIVAVQSDDIGESLTRAIVSPNEITGETIREAGLFGSGTLLTRHELAAFDVLADQRVSSSETTLFTGDN